MSAACSRRTDKTSSSSDTWDSSNSDSDDGQTDNFTKAHRRLKKCQKQESLLLSDIKSLTDDKNILVGDNQCLTLENDFLKEQLLNKEHEMDSLKVQWWEEKEDLLKMQRAYQAKINELEDHCSQNHIPRYSHVEVGTADGQELRAAQEKVRGLVSANDSLKYENRVLIERNGKYEAQVRELESPLYRKTESVNNLKGDLKEELRTVSDDMIQLRLMLSELETGFEAKRNQLASKIDDFKQTTDRLTAELYSKQAEVSLLRSRIQCECNERIYKEHAEVHNTLVAEIQSLNSALEEQKTNLFFSEAERLKSALEKEREVNERLSVLLSTLQVEYRDHQRENSHMKTGITDLYKELQMRSSEIDRMKEEASELKIETEMIMSGLQTCQNCEVVQNKYQVLVDDHSTLQSLYQEQQAETSRLLNLIPDLESQCRGLEGQIQIERNYFSNAHTMNCALTEHNETLNQKVDEMKMTIENKQAEIEQITKDRQQMEQSLAEGHQIVENLEQQLTALSDAQDITSALVSDLMCKIEDETNKLREEEVSRSLLNETLREEVAQLEEMIEENKAVIDQMKQQSPEPKTEELTSAEMWEQLTMLKQENCQLLSDKCNLAADLTSLQSSYKKVVAEKKEQYKKALSDLHQLRTQLVCAKQDMGNIEGIWNETKDGLERRISLEEPWRQQLLTEYKNTIEGLEEQLQNQTEEARQLKKQTRSLEDQAIFLTKTNDEIEKLWENDREVIKKTEIERDNLFVTVTNLQKNLQHFKDEVTDYSDEAKRLKAVIAKHEFLIEQRNAVVTELRSDVSELKHQLTEAELTLLKKDELLAKQMQEKDRHELLVRELGENLDDRIQEISELKRELEQKQEDQIFESLSEQISQSTLNEESRECDNSSATVGPSDTYGPNKIISAETPISSNIDEPQDSISDVQHTGEGEHASILPSENESLLESGEIEITDTTSQNVTQTDASAEGINSSPPTPESAGVNCEAATTKPKSTFRQVARSVARGVVGLSAFVLSCSVCYMVGCSYGEVMSCDPTSYYGTSTPF